MAAALTKLGMHPEEEFITEEGYSIDEVVDWECYCVAIEIDGPSHFSLGGLGHSAAKPVLLECRQLRALGP